MVLWIHPAVVTRGSSWWASCGYVWWPISHLILVARKLYREGNHLLFTAFYSPNSKASVKESRLQLAHAQ